MSSQKSLGVPLSSRQMLDGLTPRAVAGPAALLLILMLVFLAVNMLAPPQVAPANAPATTFSAARARTHLDAFISRPRPLGTEENAKVRTYIMNQLRAVGLTPEVQNVPLLPSTSPTANSLLLHTPTNVLARMKGTDNTKAILLMAHYDSVSSSTSANDGAGSVAMLLEAARALRAGPALRNDVIFLFTDGEELHLLGSQAFVTLHPWAKDVGLVLNFVARGTGGSSIMFETSPRNGWLIQEFAQVAPHPIANSLTYEVYRNLLPNDTDFTPFKAADFAGFNFAYIEGIDRYHTMRDDLKHVNERGIQHQGEQALAFTQHFGNLDLNNTRATDAVYFDLLGLTLVHYSSMLALVLIVLTIALFVGVVVFGVRRKRLTGRGIAFGLLSFGVSTVIAAGTVGLLWAGIRLLHSGYRAMPWGATYNSGIYMAGFVVLAVAIIAALHVDLRTKTSTQNLAVGALLGLLILLAVGGFLRPGTSYLLTWPLLTSLLALGYSFTAKDPDTLSWKHVAALLLGAVPGLVLFVPTIYLTYQAISLPLSAAAVAMVGLLLGTLVPHLQFMAAPNKWLLPGIAGVIGVGCLVGGSLTAGFDADHPKPNSIFYVLDGNNNKALWASTDERPDQWTGQFLSGTLTQDTLAAFFPFTERSFLTANAPVAPLQPPSVTVLDNTTSGNVQNLRLHISSPRKDNVVVAYFRVTPGTKLRVEGNGRQIETTPRGDIMVVGYVAPPAGGFDLNVQLDPPQPLKVAITDITHGLPEIPGTSYQPRPDTMIPTPFFEIYQDVTFIHKWFEVAPPSARSTSKPVARRAPAFHAN